MPDAGVESHWGLVGEPPVEVEVTVLTAPRRPTVWERVGHIPALRIFRVVLAVVIGAAATASVVVALTTGGPGQRTILEASSARQPRDVGAAAADGYPLRCLSVAIALHDPRFARSDFDRRLPCGRHPRYATAESHRFGGRAEAAGRRDPIYVPAALVAATRAP